MPSASARARAWPVVGFGPARPQADHYVRRPHRGAVGMRLIAAPRMGAVEFEEAFGKRTRLVHATDEEQGLAQLDEHQRRKITRLPGATRSNVWPREGRASATRPAMAYAATQEGGGHGKKRGMLAVWQSARLRSSARIAWWMSPWRRRATQPREAQRQYSRAARLPRQSVPPLLPRLSPRRSPPVRLDTRPHNNGRHGGLGAPAEVRRVLLAGEHRHRLPRDLEPLPKVPPSIVRLAQARSGR